MPPSRSSTDPGTNHFGESRSAVPKHSQRLPLNGSSPNQTARPWPLGRSIRPVTRGAEPLRGTPRARPSRWAGASFLLPARDRSGDANEVTCRRNPIPKQWREQDVG